MMCAEGSGRNGIFEDDSFSVLICEKRGALVAVRKAGAST